MDDTFPLSLKCLRMLYCDRFWLPYIAVLHDGALHKQPTVSAVLSTRDDSTDSETAVQQGCPTLAATAIHHEVSRSNCFSSSNFPLSVCLSLSHSLWLSVSLSLSLGIILSGNSLSFPWSEKSVGKVPPPTLPFNSYHGWNGNNNLARTTLLQMWAVMHPDIAMFFFSVGAVLKNVIGVEQLS